VGRQSDILVTGNDNEIYGHFTCDDECWALQWTRAQPPFLLSLTAARTILHLHMGPARGPFLLVALNGGSRPCRSCAMAPLFEIHVPYLLTRLRTWARRYLERADRTPKPRAKPTIRHTRLGSIFLLNLGRSRSPVPSFPYLCPRADL
jgi:hypothetical protein